MPLGLVELQEILLRRLELSVVIAVVCVTIGIVAGIVACIFAAIPDDSSFWD